MWMVVKTLGGGSLQSRQRASPGDDVWQGSLCCTVVSVIKTHCERKERLLSQLYHYIIDTTKKYCVFGCDYETGFVSPPSFSFRRLAVD